MTPARFNLQGHRGARGLKPENTLPSFEATLDLGVTSIETDLHLTSDGVPIICHEPVVSELLCRLTPNNTASAPSDSLWISQLTRAQLTGYCADRNPDPRRFPTQDPSVTPLARLFAERQGLDPYSLPSLTDLFAFVEAYAGELGMRAGKTLAQQVRARQVVFDLELKRVPFYPQGIGDVFDGIAPGQLEQCVVEAVQAAGVLGRTAVRSFDHRCVKVLRRLAPDLTAAVLIAETAPVAPAQLVRDADAHMYCPSYQYLDEGQIQQLHAAGFRVVPWTVNDLDAWCRLVDWGVDGITTDYPDQLATLLRQRGVAY